MAPVIVRDEEVTCLNVNSLLDADMECVAEIIGKVFQEHDV